MRAEAIGKILELARWAPSGDNTQPWRFEIVDDSTVIIHGFDTRKHCVYDLDGHASQLSIGALIETAAIAASAQGLRMNLRRLAVGDATHPTFELLFASDSNIQRSNLAAAIMRRSVQRRAMKTRALTAAEKTALDAAAGEHGLKVHWLEGFDKRLSVARLLFTSARLRLTMPEAYTVHRDVIEWDAQFSEDRVPDQALGVDPVTLKLMRFVMKNWERVSFFNRYLAGTWVPRIQMDIVPALACGAHFILHASNPPQTMEDYVQAGRAAQRFWLTATELDLMLQPETTPLIFARFAREKTKFSDSAGMDKQAKNISANLDALLGRDIARMACFMGRIGAGPAPSARSLRKAVEKLAAK